jgi:hypothetical protein
MSDNEGKFHNPFADALKDFKPSKKIVENPEKQSAELPQQDNETSAETSQSKAVEDYALFKELVESLNLQKLDHRRKPNAAYYRVQQLIIASRRHQVAYEIHRWLQWRYEEAGRPVRAGEIIDFVLKRGYESEALRWIKSATPEGMRYGKSTKDFRVEEAKKMAKEANTTLEEIAKRYNVKIP